MLFEHHVHITLMGTCYSFLGHTRPRYEGIRSNNAEIHQNKLYLKTDIGICYVQLDTEFRTKCFCSCINHSISAKCINSKHENRHIFESRTLPEIKQ